MMGPYWSYPGWGWGWMAFGWIMMVVFWGLVIAGIVAVVRYAAGRSAPPEAHREETPAEILRRRYAKGELTKEQFEEMKRDVA